MSTYNTLKVEPLAEGVSLVTMNRPDRLNAISWEMVEEFHAYLSDLESDLDTRVVMLTGEGRAFCSGTDLKAGSDDGNARDNPTPAKLYRRQRRIADLVLHMRKIPQPIIAAVNGVAAGGGFSFSMACDIRVAAESASFIASFINIGLSAGDLGSSYFLPRLVGVSRASEIMLTGRRVYAEEAERIGLVSKVVPDGDVIEASLQTAQAILGKSPFGIRMTKELLNHSVDAPSLESALYMENRTQSLAVLTGDFVHAIEAFHEKRPAKFPKET